MKIKKQFGEQETQASAETSGGGGGGAPSSKWESGAQRGKANPIDSKSKWESGATRGKANPLN